MANTSNGTYFPVVNTGSLKIADTAVTATATQINNAASTAATTAQLDQVATAIGSVAFDKLVKIQSLALTSAADNKISVDGGTAAATVAWQNPEAGAIAIVRAMLDVTTQSSGACTLDIGPTATNATTSSDTLFDGLSVAAAGLFDTVNDTHNGTNGLAYAQRLAAGKWVTVTDASGDPTGLAATLHIFYLVL